MSLTMILAKFNRPVGLTIILTRYQACYYELTIYRHSIRLPHISNMDKEIHVVTWKDRI